MGDVDSGKSTIIAQLLYHLNPSIRRRGQWHELTDALEYERYHSMTFAVAHQFCQWQDFRLQFRDDPGHPHLLAHTVSGLWNADLILYVVNIAKWDKNIIKFHWELLKWLQSPTPLFIINHCDLIEWNRETIDDCIGSLKNIVNRHFRWAAVSGASGENIFIKRPGQDQTLFDVLTEQLQLTYFRSPLFLDSFKLWEAFLWEDKKIEDHWQIFWGNQKVNLGGLKVSETKRGGEGTLNLYRIESISGPINLEQCWGVLVDPQKNSCRGIVKAIQST